MADTTHNREELPREDVAAYLQDIATEFAAGDGPVTIAVGNKQVELAPPPTVEVDTTVEERSKLLGDTVETITVELRWRQKD
ncbi:amphi-Trp domain-containing protein [Haloferacaceae archaeon DSL9]